MKVGKIINYIISISIVYGTLYAEDKITSTPIINLENLKPSYEEVLDEEKPLENEIKLKEKKKITKLEKAKNIKIMGLDKITAKTREIEIQIGKTKKYGLLEIKAVSCGRSLQNNKEGDAAYIQVKDTSESQSEKVFIFNGWTFSLAPTITPIDHAIYDIWLVGCEYS